MSCGIDFFAGELSFASARDVFARNPGGNPEWYKRRFMTTQQAANVLGRDHSTLRQQAKRKLLPGERTEKGWRFSWQDLTDYVLAELWRPVGYERWRPDEIDRLKRGLEVDGRSAEACRVMRSKIKRRSSCSH